MNDLKYSILINKAEKQFADRGFECMLAVVLALGTLALLMLFPVAGVALAIFASCFLCVGVKRYLLAIAKNVLFNVENIFKTFKICLKAFCLKVAVMLISFLWGIICIIPGIICLLNYSMASFYLADDEKLSVLECMAKSKKLVSGYRIEIFVLYLSYFFVTLITLTLFSALALAFKYYTNINTWIPVVCVIVAFLFVLIIFIIPYFELVFANVFVELTKAKETKKTARDVRRTTSKSTNKSSNKKQTTKTN